MTEQEQTALVPITEALPELRDEQYAKVCEWDAARMALVGEYEAADGEYLAKIRDALKIAGHGLWTRYLRARNIPEQTAYRRIQVAEGRFIRPKPISDIGLRSRDVIPQPVETPAYARIAEPEPPSPVYEPVTTWEDIAAQNEPEPEEEDEEPPYVAAWSDDEAEEDAEDDYTPPTFTPAVPSLAPLPITSARPGLNLPPDLDRARREAERTSPSAQAMPFTSSLVKLGECVLVKDDVIETWLDLMPQRDWEHAEYTLSRIQQWAEHAAALFKARRQQSFRIVKGN